MQRIWESYGLPGRVSKGFVTALVRNVNVAVIDCSTSGKGLIGRDIGEAINEGMHLVFDSICPNVKYVHRRDADTNYGSHFMSGFMSFAEKSRPDVVILSQYTNSRTHWEQISLDMPAQTRFALLVQSLTDTIYNRFAQYLRVNTDLLGGSQIIFSRKAYEKYEYPSGEKSEDWKIGRWLTGDPELKIAFPNSEQLLLHLTDRGRPESIDGKYSLVNLRATADSIRDSKNTSFVSYARGVVSEYDRIYRTLQQKRNKNKLLELERITGNFQQKIHFERQVFLRRFQQIVPLILDAVSGKTDFNELNQAIADRTAWGSDFFAANPVFFAYYC